MCAILSYFGVNLILSKSFEGYAQGVPAEDTSNAAIARPEFEGVGEVFIYE
jgi:hypothetical protein